MRYTLCRHIRTSGVQCHSPALTGKLHCFFHARMYQRHSGFRPPELAPASDQQLQLVPLEDRDSIQIALSQVIHALAAGQLEPRRATALLYGLQMASSNCRRFRSDPPAKDIVRTVQSTPDGLELARPGATGEDYVSYDQVDDQNDDEEDDQNDDPENASTPPHPRSPTGPSPTQLSAALTTLLKQTIPALRLL